MAKILDHGYPRPQLVRLPWTSLDGHWQFAIDAPAQWTSPADFKPTGKILVPFAPETPASGVNDNSFYKAVWYRRTFTAPALSAGERLILHFAAVDYIAQVWVNDKLAVEHEGGYTPFHADITDLLTASGPQSIVVRAVDDPHDMTQPRGKQDWELKPHGCWYARTTGIWQSVWMESVPATRVAKIDWTADVPRWRIRFDATLTGPVTAGLSLHVKLTHKGNILVEDQYALTSPHIDRTLAIKDEGLYWMARGKLLWHPLSPQLIDAEFEIRNAQGQVIDRVTSYTAMRNTSLRNGRFHINDAQMQLQMALDQGYWPKTGLTAPDDAAMRRDVELTKAMGFNAVRKHQKIESPRFLYWADVLGLMVWSEMPATYTFNSKAVLRITRQWTEAVMRDRSHPCIIAWVPFNESWGIGDQHDVPEQCSLVYSIYHLTKTLDPARPVIGNDGWENLASDIVTIHDYDASTQRITERYAGMPHKTQDILRYARPCGKDITLKGFVFDDQPIMITEFGGIALSRDKKGTWGYSRATNAQDFAAKYAAVMEAVRDIPRLAGYCYTQLTDCYQEANGLLYMDRTPKFPLDQIAVATRGAHNPTEQKLAESWRRRIKALAKHPPR